MKIVFNKKILIMLMLVFLVGCKANESEVYQKFVNSNDKTNFEDEKTTIDIDEFMKKIWIVDGWEGKADYPISLVIESADEGFLRGYFRMGYSVASDYFNCYIDNREKIPEFSGKINGGTVQGEYDYKDGRRGVITICFCDNNRINVKIDGNDNETYILRPYNISDEDFQSEITYYKTELGIGGVVTIAYGICDALHPYPKVFLLNEERDIIYRFGGFTSDSEVKEVIVADMNGDGLKDVEVITYFSYAPDEYQFEDYFYQTEDGHFYLKESLNFGKEWGNM